MALQRHLCCSSCEQTPILRQLFPLEESVRDMDLLDKAIVVSTNTDDSSIGIGNVRCVPPQILGL